MPQLNVKETLELLKKATEENIKTVEGYKSLTDDALNTKPAEDKWSVAECVKHMNIANDYYIDNLYNKINTAIKNGIKPTETYKSGWLGEKSARSMEMKPSGEPNGPMKTLKMFYPEKSKINAQEAINYFIERQNKILTILELAHQTNIGKIRVPLSMTKLITLKVGDTLRFIINHTTRHVAQAEKVLAQIQ